MVQLFWLIGFILFSAGSTYALQVNIHPSAVVVGNQVHIADVAALSPPQGELSAQRIGRAPALGRYLSVTKNQIERVLLQHGVAAADLHFNGVLVSRVKRACVTVTAVQAQHYIDVYLANAQKKMAQVQFKFTPQAPIKDIVLPQGNLRVEVIPSLAQIIGSRRFTLIYRVNGRTVKNISISGKLEALANVAVAQRNLRRGIIISAADVNLTLLDISRIAQPFFTLSDVVGKQVIRSVRAATVLEDKYLAVPPLVKKGAFVKLIARRGSMLLTATGIALQAGVMAEVIRVRNSSSQKEVLARVIGRDKVEVGF